jgi:glycosyltransferase involved in cell wall biosynthesis
MSNNSKKRILIFSLAYYPFVGGAEVAVKEITDRIPDIDFDMVTLRFNDEWREEERIGNVNVYRVKASKLTFPIEAMLYARKLQAKVGYDAIWAIMAARAGGAALFFKYGYPKIPFVLTLQEGDPISYMKLRSLSFINPFFKRIFVNADIIQTISTYLSGYATAMGYSGNPVVIPNGVDFLSFNKRDLDKEESLKKLFGKRDDETFLITTSRLVKKNGIRYVIEALRNLPNTRFLILGEGPLKSTLTKLATELGVERQVQFIGHVDYNEIPTYLHISDIFIRPSLSEGFGNSFIEAMAAGLPVIATPVGGIPDFLFDPGENPGKPSTGIFVKPEDSISIVDAVKKISGDRELRNSLIKNGVELVREGYDWNLVARRMKKEVLDITKP